MRYNTVNLFGSGLLAVFSLFAMTTALGQSLQLPKSEVGLGPVQPQPAVCAAGPLLYQGKQWHYSVTPYAWLSSIDGTVGARGLQASVDASVGDIIDKLNWITQLHMEAQKDDWGLYVDPIFVKLSAGGSVGAVPASVGFTQWLVEFAGTYRLMGRSSGPGYPSNSLRALLGGRFWSLKNSITVADGRSASRTRQWIDPIIGLRYTAGNKPWSFVLQGDIGGFGVASEFTWSLAPVLTYSLSDAGSLVVGYRVLGVDYATGSGNDSFLLDVNYSGPILGYAFSF